MCFFRFSTLLVVAFMLLSTTELFRASRNARFVFADSGGDTWRGGSRPDEASGAISGGCGEVSDRGVRSAESGPLRIDVSAAELSADSRIGWHGAGTGAARAETERSPETVSSVKPRRPRVDASALLIDVAALASEVEARGATGVSVIAVAGALFPSQARRDGKADARSRGASFASELQDSTSARNYRRSRPFAGLLCNS